jgi:tetratricopeptide (TPR) repeat protein
LQDKKGKSYNFRQILSERNILLVFFNPESETSIKMLYSIQSLVDIAASKDITVLAVQVDSNRTPDKLLNQITLPILLDKDMSVTNRFIPDVTSLNRDILPSILLFNRNGELLLWKEGYNLAVDHMLVDAFNTLLGKKMPATATLEALETRVKLREGALDGLDHAEKGLEYLSAGDYAKAVAYYKEATRAFPNASELWYNYTCALARNNNLNEAIGALGKAVRLGFNNLDWIKKDPDLESLRKDKRFEAIVK